MKNAFEKERRDQPAQKLGERPGRSCVWITGWDQNTWLNNCVCRSKMLPPEAAQLSKFTFTQSAIAIYKLKNENNFKNQLYSHNS